MANILDMLKWAEQAAKEARMWQEACGRRNDPKLDAFVQGVQAGFMDAVKVLRLQGLLKLPDSR